MSRFVVVGDLMTDVVARAMGPVEFGTDTPSWVESYGGGAGANVAAWLGVTGHEVTYVGRRGPDVVGRTREMELLGYGIDSRVVMDQNRPTGTCVVVVGEDGERTMFPDAGANAALLPEDIPAQVFDEDTHLHLSGYPLLSDTARDAALTALRYAARLDLTVSVDASSVALLRRMGVDAFLALTAGATLLLANLDEARFLTGEQAAGPAAQRLAKTYPHVVVKAGATGSVWCSAGENVVPALPEVVDVVDSTGAGDAYCAGLLPAWLDGGTPAECLAAGNQLAVRALSQAGARPVD